MSLPASPSWGLPGRGWAGWWWLDGPPGPGATWLVPQAPWELAAGAATGLDPAGVRMLVAFLAAYPLASVLRRLPTAAAKHAFSLVAGLVFLIWACDRAAWYPVATVAVCYAVVRLVPPARAPWLVLATTLAVLSFAHLRRMALDQTAAWDFSGPQMVLSIKLSNVAFEVLDGVRLHRAGPVPPTPPTTATSPRGHAAKHPRTAWRQERLERAILHPPSPLEFFGYALFFGSVLVGPAFDYLEYSSAISGTKYRRLGPGLAASRAADGAAAPRSVHHPSAERAYFRLLAQALVFLAIHLVLSAAMPVDTMRDPAFLHSGSVLSRGLWIYYCMAAERFKYYFVWLTTEGACMASGFGWVYTRRVEPAAPSASGGAAASAAEVATTEADLAGSWSGVSNIDPWGFETADSIRQASVVWNKHTSTWLRRCVYERVPAPARLLATYAVSALWHGFLPGYYAFFLSAAAAQVLNGELRSRVRPWFLPGAPLARYKRWYDVAGIIATSFTINYLAPSFVLHTMAAALALWGSLAFAGHVAIAGLLVAVFLFGRPPPRPPKQTE